MLDRQGINIRPVSKRQRKIKQEFYNLLVYFLVLIFFLPVLWIIMTAMRPEVEVNARPPVYIPSRLSIETFAQLLGQVILKSQFPFIVISKTLS